MGQKVHPYGFRLGIIKTWNSKWFEDKAYAKWLHEDIRIKRAVKDYLMNANLASVEVERAANKAKVIVFTARPGMVIGKGGKGIETLKTGMIDAVQVIYNIFEQEPQAEFLPAALENRVGVIVRVVFDEGSLTGKFTEQTTFAEGDFRKNYFAGDRLERTVKRVEKIRQALGTADSRRREILFRRRRAAPGDQPVHPVRGPGQGPPAVLVSRRTRAGRRAPGPRRGVGPSGSRCPRRDRRLRRQHEGRPRQRRPGHHHPRPLTRRAANPPRGSLAGGVAPG